MISTVSKDLLWVGVGRLTTAIAALVAIRLSTALLPPAEYGILAILITLQTFPNLFLINPVGQYINRYTHSWADDGTLISRLNRFRRWVYFAAAIGALITGCWSMLQSRAPIECVVLMAAVAAMVVSATWNATSISILNMLGFRVRSVLWGIGTTLISLSTSSLLVIEIGGGFSWFCGQVIGMAAGAIGAGRDLAARLPSSEKACPRLNEGNMLIAYAAPLAVATGFMWWLQSGYRLLLESNWGVATLGYAVVGLALASQVWGLLESLMMQVFFPFFYRKIAGGKTESGAFAYADLLNSLGPVYILAAGACFLAAPSIIAILVHSTYSGVIVFFLLGSVFECFRVITNLFAAAAQVELRTRSIIPAYAVGAAFLTIGVFAVARNGGAMLDAIKVVSISGFLVLIVMVASMNRLRPFKLDAARWSLALALTSIGVAFGIVAPFIPSGLGSAAVALVFAGLPFAAVSSLMLWFNPAMRRLVDVGLGPVKR